MKNLKYEKKIFNLVEEEFSLDLRWTCASISLFCDSSIWIDGSITKTLSTSYSATFFGCHWR